MPWDSQDKLEDVTVEKDSWATWLPPDQDLEEKWMDRWNKAEKRDK